jgi:acetyltransferase-like isoleucine patch superfamily enzyme
MFERIYNSLLYRIQKALKPEMISGFSNNPQKKGIRISNHTHISFPGNLKLGNNVFIGHFNYIDCFKEVTIGDGVQITNYCSILNHSSHHSIRLHGSHYLEHAPFKLVGLQEGAVSIGEYTYIGAHSVIMPGTVLGKGTIVGAYSYVNSGTYPDFAILRGIPAKVIGSTLEIDEKFLIEFPELKNSYYQHNK